MKKKNYSVMGLVHKAITDCMNYSETHRSDIFIDYQAHVSKVKFSLYENGWRGGRDAAITIELYLSGRLSLKTPEEAERILKPIYVFMNENV